MCPPALAWASFIVAAAGEGTNLYMQKQQQNAQVSYQEQMGEQQNKIAASNMANVRSAEAQDAEARAREGEKARLATQKAEATATVAAGESGVGGNSVNALLQEYVANLGQYKEAASRQAAWNETAENNQLTAIRLGSQSSILQLQQPVAGPNYAASATRLGAAGFGAYRDYNPDAFRKPLSTTKAS